MSGAGFCEAEWIVQVHALPTLVDILSTVVTFKVIAPFFVYAGHGRC